MKNSGEKRLGQAVIISAVVDYLTDGGYSTSAKNDRKIWKEQAKSFLFSDVKGYKNLRQYWCALSGWNEEYIQKGVRGFGKGRTGLITNARALRRMIASLNKVSHAE